MRWEMGGVDNYVALVAPITPPETGASTKSCPRAYLAATALVTLTNDLCCERDTHNRSGKEREEKKGGWGRGRRGGVGGRRGERLELFVCARVRVVRL